MEADYEKYKHLVFNGALPKGYDFTEHWRQKVSFFFTAKLTLEETLAHYTLVIVLLDNGLLVYANYGNKYKENLDKNDIFLGHGIVHKGLLKCQTI